MTPAEVGSAVAEHVGEAAAVTFGWRGEEEEASEGVDGGGGGVLVRVFQSLF